MLKNKFLDSRNAQWKKARKTKRSDESTEEESEKEKRERYLDYVKSRAENNKENIRKSHLGY